MAPPEAREKRLPLGVGGALGADAAPGVELQAVDDDKAAAGMGLPAMKDSAKKSRAVPLITTRGRPTALMKGPAAFAQDVDVPPLAPYMKV